MWHMHDRPGRPLLAIDIGNTSVALCLFASPHNSIALRTAKIALVDFSINALLAHLKALPLIGLRGEKFDAVISSVVPAAAITAKQALRSLPASVLVVTHELNLGITFAVEKPDKVGTDRIANAVAAHDLVKEPVVIADCGSATTLSLIAMGTFLGGAIMPGVCMMRDVLKEKTARLPAVPLKLPPSAIGTDTRSALQSGIIFGTAGAIEGIIRHAQRETGLDFALLVTGGNASLLLDALSLHARHEPDLTFQGLRRIFLLNL